MDPLGPPEYTHTQPSTSPEDSKSVIISIWFETALRLRVAIFVAYINHAVASLKLKHHLPISKCNQWPLRSFSTGLSCSIKPSIYIATPSVIRSSRCPSAHYYQELPSSTENR
ncbi:hypothetical protein BDN67DRAFT_964764 [Paxillus ammoniavirescens]|nr:hypothetical protein BDN67DRAFT_964764 [Paxillus ammoniavirescens]